MKVASTHSYAATPDVVFAMMTTPAVLTEKYAALGHKDMKMLEHSDVDGEVSVRSRRSVPMEVPGFAKRFLSPMNSVEQRDHWHAPDADRVRVGTWEVQAKGVPVSAGGTLRLAPGPGRTTIVEIVGEVKSSVPLLGGKLASFVGADVQRTLEAEEAFNDGYLARRKRPTTRAK
ncbi:MAG: DUF2505 domain-containing protein [Ilumatobacteraceae bacterium]